MSKSDCFPNSNKCFFFFFAACLSVAASDSDQQIEVEASEMRLEFGWVMCKSNMAVAIAAFSQMPFVFECSHFALLSLVLQAV